MTAHYVLAEVAELERPVEATEAADWAESAGMTPNAGWMALLRLNRKRLLRRVCRSYPLVYEVTDRGFDKLEHWDEYGCRSHEFCPRCEEISEYYQENNKESAEPPRQQMCDKVLG